MKVILLSIVLITYNCLFSLLPREIQNTLCVPVNLIFTATILFWAFTVAGVSYSDIGLSFTQPNVLIEQWRRGYNQLRPHSALKYQPPAPEAILTMATR